MLIAGLKNVTSDAARAKKTDEILKVFDRDVSLRKKKDFVRKFIEEHLPKVSKSEDVEAAFAVFWASERSETLRKLAEDEKINSTQIEDLIGEYLYTNRLPTSEEVLDKLPERPSLMNTKKVADRIKAAISNLVEVFEW